VVDITANQVEELIKRHGDAIRPVALPGFAFEYLILNARKPPFDNVKVRQALYLWMDRAQFREKAFQGKGYLTSWIDPVHYPGYGTPEAELAKTELGYQPNKSAARARAKELLAEAGYPDLSKFQTRVLPFRNQGTALVGGQVAVAQLRELGFDAVLDAKEALAFTEALGRGDFEVSYYNGGVGYSAADSILTRYLSSKGQRNYSGLVDTTLDNLIQRVLASPDLAQHKTRTAELEKYLLTGQNATQVMMYRQRTELEWKYLRGHRYLSGYQEHMNIRTWLAQDAPGRR
jgi:peptide/nickel transport system substrate-binding protein